MTELIRYNVRVDGYDPTKPIGIEPFPIPSLLAGAPIQTLLVSRKTLIVIHGELGRQLADAMLPHVPVTERDRIKFTLRVEQIRTGQRPSNVPKSWHTDYAHTTTNVSTRLKVHSYVLATAAPPTRFFITPDLELPDPRNAEFKTRITGLPTFETKPWTLVRFNATELHDATAHVDAEPSFRLFFRGTFDTFR